MATDAAPVPTRVGPHPPTTDPDDTGDAERRITRQFARFVGAGYLVYLFLTGADVVNAFSVTATWWAVLGPTVIFGTGIAVGIAGLRGSMRTIRVCVIVAAAGYLLMVLTWFPAWNGLQISNNRGMFFSQFNGVPALAVALVCRLRWSMLYLAVAAVAVATAGYYVRAPAYTSPLLGEIAWSFGFCMTFVVAASIGVRTARVLDETRAQTYLIAGTEAALSARETERMRFDALTHDGVMSTLLGAARQGNTAGITASARRTIGDLARLGRSEPADHHVDEREVMALLRNTIAEIDDSVAVDVAGRTAPSATYPSEAVRTMCAATGEALRNSLRHAGTGARATVEASFAADSLSMMVIDNGIGFDQASVPPHRLGIAVSIRGRLNQLPGGRAVIDSVPGQGTRVEMAWTRS